MKKKPTKETLALNALKEKQTRQKKEIKSTTKKKKVSIQTPSHHVETTWESLAKKPQDVMPDEPDSDTEFYPQKRTSTTERRAKIPKTAENGALRIQRLEKLLSDQKESFKSLETELRTHAEAIQGLMQVVSTPQNLANFQQQYAYSQLGPRSPGQQQVQYMPVFYPQPMYYQQIPQQAPLATTAPAQPVPTMVQAPTVAHAVAPVKIEQQAPTQQAKPN